MSNEPTKKVNNRLSSEELAGLIVDALYMGGVISESSYAKAMAIAVEEIEARKAGGDY